MRGGSGGEPNGVQQPQQQGQEEEEVEDERMQERGAQRQQRRQQRSSSASQHPQPPRSVGYVGKHRLSAAIARLDQELQSLQDELNELEMMEAASAECKEVITSTEGKPDPLLPVTSGPENSSWDRWFQRVRSSRSSKWWASKGSDFS